MARNLYKEKLADRRGLIIGGETDHFKILQVTPERTDSGKQFSER